MDGDDRGGDAVGAVGAVGKSEYVSKTPLPISAFVLGTLELESLSRDDFRVETVGEPVRLSAGFERDISISLCGGPGSACSGVQADERGDVQCVKSVVLEGRCGRRT